MNIILIPAHLVKLTYLSSLLNSANENNMKDTKIVICVSNSHEKFVMEDRFKHLPIIDNLEFFNGYEHCDEKISKNFARYYEQGGNRSIVNIKKFIGLTYIFEKYNPDYISCVDCDIKFLKNPDMMLPRVIENYESGKFFGSEHSGYSRYNHASINLFKDEDKSFLYEQFASGNLYTWFHDVPIYKREDYNLFINYMIEKHGSYENFLYSLTADSFEHIVYTMFRVSKLNATVINYSRLSHNIPEFLNTEDHNVIKSTYGYEPLWVNHKINIDGFDPFILCHVDRR